MKNSYGYESYRGRSRLQAALTVLAVILFVVLLLAIAFFFFAQEYIVYDDSGKAHLEFPFFQQIQPTPTPELQSPPVIVIETPPPIPTPTPPPIPGAVELPVEALTDGTAAEQVEALGGNRVIFTMKDELGFLSYFSHQEMASIAGVNPADETINDAIRAFNQGELYTIARVSLFKDRETAGRYSAGNALRSKGGNWRGPDGSRWFSPASQTARDYLVEICVELAQLGFDELLLEHCAYPSEGHTEWILPGELYDTDRLTDGPEAFCAQLQEALVDYPDLTISLLAEPSFLSPEGADLSGQTPWLFTRYARRIYLPASDGETDWSPVLSDLDFEERDLLYADRTGPQTAGWWLPLAR